MANVHIRDRDAVFVHVPKTAGASARLAFESGGLDVDLRPNRGLTRRWTTAEWAEHCFGRRIWREARCFAFVRNPWDWTVSGYLYVTRNRPHYRDPPGFADFVKGRWRHGLTRNPHRKKFASARLSVIYHTQTTQWRHLHPHWWSRLPDYAFIGRFERFETDWREAFELLGLEPPEIGHANKSVRAHYSTYYDDETRRIVQRRNRPLIERFGYRFES